MPTLNIKKTIWLLLMRELKKRGKGKRESGAFLLGKEGSKKISEFICYDDLDPYCLTGMVEFDASGFGKLWQYCNEKQLKVLADIHTHPGNWTDQSITDQENPMICIKGHLALIVPCFAKNDPQLLRGVGVFEYLGGSQWKKHKTKILKLN